MAALNGEIEGRRTSLWTRSFFREGEGFVSSPQPVVRSSNQRASSAHIGAVMAVLATFDEAKVLPPEHDSQANQLIHTLIQLQSVVMKSQDSKVRNWVLKALQAKLGEVAAQVQEHVRATGLTMDCLEALVDYGDSHPFWDRAELAGEFQAYNVKQEDWMLLRRILLDARRQLAGRGDTLSAVFARRRLEMPGAVLTH